MLLFVSSKIVLLFDLLKGSYYKVTPITDFVKISNHFITFQRLMNGKVFGVSNNEE